MLEPKHEPSRRPDDDSLLRSLTAELRDLEAAGKLSRESIERELLWLAVIITPNSAPGVGWTAGERPLTRLCSLILEDASRLRRESRLLRQLARVKRAQGERVRARAELRVLEGGAQ